MDSGSILGAEIHEELRKVHLETRTNSSDVFWGILRVTPTPSQGILLLTRATLAVVMPGVGVTLGCRALGGTLIYTVFIKMPTTVLWGGVVRLPLFLTVFAPPA